MRKALIFVFSLLSLLVLGFSFKTNVNALVVTSNDILVEGASVRLNGNSGLRFVGKVTDSFTENAKAYGICLVPGKIPGQLMSDFVINGLVADYEVANGEVSEIDENGNFFVVLWDIPENAYNMKINARAYVVLEDNSVVYSSTIITRNLSEVVLKACNDGCEGDFLTDVTDYLNDNYMKVGFDTFGNYTISNLYENDYSKLHEEFIKDVNANFETTLTMNTTWTNWYDAFRSYTGDGLSSNVDITDSVLYKFFNDEVLGAKWGWLIDFLNAYGNTHLSNQIKAIKGDGTKEGSSCDYALYRGYHTIESLYNFFYMLNQQNYTKVGFPNESSYAKLNQSVIFADLSKYQLATIGQSMELDATYPHENCNLLKFYSEEKEYDLGDFIPVTATKTQLLPIVEYTVSSADVAALNIILTENENNIPNKIVFIKGKVMLKGDELNSLYEEKVIECFNTISTAVTKATNNDIIYTFAGTYTEDFEISKSIKIYGPNTKILGNGTRVPEADIAAIITVSANNVLLSGIKLSGTSKTITWTKDISNLTIENLYSITGGKSTKGGRTAIISSDYGVTGFVLKDSFILCTGTGGRDGIAIYGTVSGFTIINNEFNNGAASYSLSEAIRINNIAGEVNISNNLFKWSTSNLSVFLGGTSNKCTKMVFANNHIAGSATAKSSTFGYRKAPSGCVVDIVGNWFEYFDTGNTISFQSLEGSTVKVKYNYFGTGVAYNYTSDHKGTLNQENNFYKETQTTATSDVSTFSLLSDLISAYKGSTEYTTFGSYCIYDN